MANDDDYAEYDNEETYDAQEAYLPEAGSLPPGRRTWPMSPRRLLTLRALCG